MDKVIPLWKSHYSLGRSILTLDDVKSDEQVNSIFYFYKKHNLDTLILTEDGISGLLEASQNCQKNKIKLIFGLRLNICNSLEPKDESILKKRAKYIIFAKNINAYKNLIKIWSFAANQGFYYTPNIDFDNLKKFWDENLILGVPFYDSFLHLNSLNMFQHVPDFSFTNPVFFIEDNNIPFDFILKDKVIKFCDKNKFNYLPAQSIYYLNKDDYLAYLTFRCINSRSYSDKVTLEKPELSHMCSNTFNAERWLELNK